MSDTQPSEEDLALMLEQKIEQRILGVLVDSLERYVTTGWQGASPDAVRVADADLVAALLQALEPSLRTTMQQEIRMAFAAMQAELQSMYYTRTGNSTAPSMYRHASDNASTASTLPSPLEAAIDAALDSTISKLSH